jgi:molybdate transport system substrate-binding protein
MRVAPGQLATVLVLLSQNTASAQIRVIMSGGFAPVYRQVLPEFERTSGLSVTTASGSSQGAGPQTIGAQLRRGVPADVVIMSREGLNALIAEGRILPGSDVDLAQTPTGVAARAGAPRPDVGSVDTFVQTLLNARLVVTSESTTGAYLTTVLFPRLGITGRVRIRVTARGSESTALLAAGEADLAVLPVSELTNVPGVDLVGPIPGEVQFVSVFAAAVVRGAADAEAARRLIAFLTSDRTTAAIIASGMEQVVPPPSN